MNKSQIADRLAGRMGLSRSAATGAVDAAFETIGEALAKHEDVRIADRGIRHVRDEALTDVHD